MAKDGENEVLEWLPEKRAGEGLFLGGYKMIVINIEPYLEPIAERVRQMTREEIEQSLRNGLTLAQAFLQFISQPEIRNRYRDAGQLSYDTGLFLESLDLHPLQREE